MVYCGVLWKSQRYSYWESFKILFAWVTILVTIEAVDQIFFNGNLFILGIKQGDYLHWYHIFFAPFIHDDFLHVFSNSIGLLVLGAFVLLLGTRVLATVTFAAIVVSGFGVLVFGSDGLHAGASSIVYGYFGFLVFRGVYEKSWKALLAGGVVLFAFQSLLNGLLPGQPGTSWHSHVFGALGGISAAATLARRNTRPRRADLGHSVSKQREESIGRLKF